MDEKKTWYEEFKVAGDDLLTKVKETIHEGNVQRIILKNEEGQTLMELPLTAGVTLAVLSVALAPALAAVGAIAALVTHVTLVVERKES